MKRALVVLVFLAVCLGSVPSALAVWGSFISTGVTTGIGNPSCAFVSTDHVVCAVRSRSAEMMVNEFNGTKWGTWTSLPGTVSFDPSCTSNGAGSVACAATASNGDLEVSIFNGTTWSAPKSVPAALYSAPSCAELPGDEVLCVARNATGGLAWSVYNGTTWTAFANLSTTAISAPSCTTDDNGGVVCAVYTIGGATLVNRFASGKWEGFLAVGGIAGGEPDCTALNSAGEVTCFAKAFDTGIFVNLYNGKQWIVSDWSGYRGLGGDENDNASCTSNSAGELVCGVIGALDNAFYANVYNGSVWSGWVKIGTTDGVGSPACAPLGTGQVVCVVMGTANKLSSVVGP